MSHMPQRRPCVSRTASYVSGADWPVQVLEECLAEIDRREAAVGAFTVVDTADMVSGMGVRLYQGAAADKVRHRSRLTTGSGARSVLDLTTLATFVGPEVEHASRQR